MMATHGKWKGGKPNLKRRNGNWVYSFVGWSNVLHEGVSNSIGGARLNLEMHTRRWVRTEMHGESGRLRFTHAEIESNYKKETFWRKQ